MSWLLTLRFDTPRLVALPQNATAPAPPPRTPPDLAALNAGQGDARSRIRPNVKHAEEPSVQWTEDGPLPSFAAWRDTRPRPRTVVLMPADDPLALQDELGALDRIALEAPTISDGRPYSSAVLIRTRLQWRGPLRVVGQVLVDQVWAYARCGVDEFALRADQDAHRALAAVRTFPSAYQWSVGDTDAAQSAVDAA